MVYFTWSEGYRPGGIQRRPSSLGEYESDFLTNTEIRLEDPVGRITPFSSMAPYSPRTGTTSRLV